MLTWEQDQIQGAPAIVQKLAVSGKELGGMWSTRGR